jgi:hypothetical protein
MSLPQIDLKALERLISDVDAADPIDWGMAMVNEDEALSVVAMGVKKMYEEDFLPLKGDDFHYAVMSSLGKLVLENFALNLRLMNK